MKTEFEDFIQQKRDSGSLCGALIAWEDGNDWELSQDDQCPHCSAEQPCDTWHMFNLHYIPSEWEATLSDS